MTPLAHRIVKELTLPLKDRTFNDAGGLLKKMSDIHCFDMSAVDEVVFDLATQFRNEPAKMAGRLAFLPAPKTWIEIADREKCNARTGVLLEEVDHPKLGRSAVLSHASEIEFDSSPGAMFMPLVGSDLLGKSFGWDPIIESNVRDDADLKRRHQVIQNFMYVLYAHLALINTPRIVGRVKHLPHKGLERALIAKHGSVGHWPLHAWHEIKLSITPPDAQPGEIEEGHLTGKKALHFVRQHLRIRLGKLEMVSSHWRGDAQLGIKRARYAVTH